MFTCPETSGKKKVARWPKGLAGRVDFVEVPELRGCFDDVGQSSPIRSMWSSKKSLVTSPHDALD